MGVSVLEPIFLAAANIEDHLYMSAFRSPPRPNDLFRPGALFVRIGVPCFLTFT